MVKFHTPESNKKVYSSDVPVRPKKNCYVALSRPTVKCEKTGSVFFFFFFFLSDLGEEFARICIQWLKKALVYGSEF